MRYFDYMYIILPILYCMILSWNYSQKIKIAIQAIKHKIPHTNHIAKHQPQYHISIRANSAYEATIAKTMAKIKYGIQNNLFMWSRINWNKILIPFTNCVVLAFKVALHSICSPSWKVFRSAYIDSLTIAFDFYIVHVSITRCIFPHISTED